MIPSRRTQPYRRGPRSPGPALSAMLRGAPAQMPNPQDAHRMARRRARRRRKRPGALSQAVRAPLSY